MKRTYSPKHFWLLLVVMFALNSTSVTAETINISPNAAYLGYFIVSKQANGAVLVKWTTISEHNHKYFSIEHSSDGVHYSVIGQVSSLGNTSNGFSYEFMDNKPAIGKNFYRLKLVDISGSHKYSDIRFVQINPAYQDKLSVFPNPAISSITLQLNVEEKEEVKVGIYDGTGNEALSKTCFIENQKIELDIESLRTGIYVIVIVTSIGKQYTSKLIVVK